VLGLHAAHRFHGYPGGTGGEHVSPDDYRGNGRQADGKTYPDSEPQPAPDGFCLRRYNRSLGRDGFRRFRGDFLHAT
jgi:hypothetical protein